MPTTQKRVQSCWPATVGRRKTFLAPTSYSSRKDGDSAKQLLTRVWQRACGLQRAYDEMRDESCPWSSLIDGPYELPYRAEDLMNVLLSEQRLSLRERGVHLTQITDLSDLEMARATAHLTMALSEQRECAPHSILLHHAIDALEHARSTIEDRTF